MNEHDIIERLPLSGWEVQLLRVTAFPSPSAQLSRPTWWTDLIGEPPEKQVLQPREQGQRDEGLVDGKRLILEVQPTRIDWLFTRAGDQEFESEGYATIGLLPEVLNAFLPLILRWFELETCPSVQRLVFGAVLLHIVENRQDGYRQLSAYLPSVQLDTEGSSDFLYQINRPRNSGSGIPDLRINRLSKWSVATVRGFTLSIGSLPVTQSVQTPEFTACRLEFDINTTQFFQGDLEREQLPQVFQELVDLGVEIVREGDVL